MSNPSPEESEDWLPDTPPEWEADDDATEALQLERWGHRIAHELGHAVAALAKGHCPERILIGRIAQNGVTHYGLTQGGNLPEGASIDDRVLVMLAGDAGERVLLDAVAGGASRDEQQAAPLITEIRERDGVTIQEVTERLVADARSLLEEYRPVLESLFAEGMNRAEAFGLINLNLNHTSLFEGAELQELFNANPNPDDNA